MEREKKVKQAEKFGRKFREVNALLLADFVGMTVAQMTKVRKELKKVNAEFRVVKNSILRFASNGTPIEKLRDKFVGTNAVILVQEDPPKVAKLLLNLAKDIPNFKIKAGCLKDYVMGPDEVNRLATLPSREVLFGQLLGALKGPQRKFVEVISFKLIRLLGILNAIKDKKERGMKEV